VWFQTRDGQSLNCFFCMSHNELPTSWVLCDLVKNSRRPWLSVLIKLPSGQVNCLALTLVDLGHGPLSCLRSRRMPSAVDFVSEKAVRTTARRSPDSVLTSRGEKVLKDSIP